MSTFPTEINIPSTQRIGSNVQRIRVEQATHKQRMRPQATKFTLELTSRRVTMLVLVDSTRRPPMRAAAKTRFAKVDTLSRLPQKALTPEDEELQRKKARLAELEAQLSDSELELASFRADLIHFEKRYLQTVGRRYALLDELKAKIAEARAKQNPRSQDARDHAQQARAKAHESARAAGHAGPDEPATDDPPSAAKPMRSASLDKLYREAARLLHPDLTLDGEEKKKRHRLMAEINDAYARGDEERVRAILRHWHASPENVQGDGPGAELVRIIRKIAQVETRLKTIATELEQLRLGELGKLKQQVDEAQAAGRDLIQDLVERLERDVAAARDELKRETHTAQP